MIAGRAIAILSMDFAKVCWFETVDESEEVNDGTNRAAGEDAKEETDSSSFFSSDSRCEEHMRVASAADAAAKEGPNSKANNPGASNLLQVFSKPEIKDCTDASLEEVPSVCVTSFDT